MKPVSTAMLTLISKQTQFAIAELYAFTLQDGSTDYFTSLDIPIIYGGHTYKANSLRIEGIGFNIGIGFKVDEQSLVINAFPGETLAGAGFYSGIASGLLDGATVVRSRAFWAVVDGPPINTYLTTPVDVIPLFTGKVSTIERIGRTRVELKLKSPLVLLDTELPRNTYQAGCLWSLYDSGCGISRPSYTASYTVSAANVLGIVPTTAITPNPGADGNPYYMAGRLIFTPGVNDGLEVSISTNDGTQFILAYPLTTLPDPGDTFDASAGCAKTVDACNLKFSNLGKLRAFPRVPPVVVAV